MAPSDLLSKDQRLEYLKYPMAGEQLLMALEPLKDTAKIIRHNQRLRRARPLGSRSDPA